MQKVICGIFGILVSVSVLAADVSLSKRLQILPRVKEKPDPKLVAQINAQNLTQMILVFRQFVSCQDRWTEGVDDRKNIDACTDQYLNPSLLAPAKRGFTNWLVEPGVVTEPFLCSQKTARRAQFLSKPGQVALCLQVKTEDGMRPGYVFYKKLEDRYVIDYLKIPH